MIPQNNISKVRAGHQLNKRAFKGLHSTLQYPGEDLQHTYSTKKILIRNERTVVCRLKLNPGSNTPSGSPFTVLKM